MRYQGTNEGIGPFVTAVRQLQGRARFGIDRLWETLMDKVNKDVREYVRRIHPKLTREYPRSEEACFATILSAGKAVEYERTREVLHDQSRKAMELLKQQGQKNPRSSTFSNPGTSGVTSGRVQKKKQKERNSSSSSSTSKRTKRKDKLAKALEGIPQDLITARRKAKLCMRCGKADHMADKCTNSQSLDEVKDKGKDKGKGKAEGKKLHLITLEPEVPQIGHFDDILDYETSPMDGDSSD